MTYIFKTKTPIYKTNTAIVFYTDQSDVKLTISGDEELKEIAELLEDIEDGPAFVLTSPGVNAVIAFFRMDEVPKDRFLFIHEALHMAFGTLRGIGAEFDESTEEHLAYLQEHYIETLEEFYAEAKESEEKFGL
jgi:hypothetical protein